MKFSKLSLNLLCLAMLVVCFTACSKDDDNIVPATEQMIPDSDSGDSGAEPVTETTPDIINTPDDTKFIEGEWTINKMTWTTEDADGNALDSGDANPDGFIIFKSNGTGTRDYNYTSAVSEPGTHYVNNTDFEYVVDEEDPDKFVLTSDSGNNVTWRRTSDKEDIQKFTLRLNIDDVLHSFDLELTRGLPVNHFIGTWDVQSINYTVEGTSNSGNAKGKGSVTFNEDGTGTRDIEFESSLLDDDNNNRVHASTSDFTWYLVGTTKIKLDVTFVNNDGEVTEWTETWTRMSNESNKQKVSYPLNIGGTTHVYEATFVK